MNFSLISANRCLAFFSFFKKFRKNFQLTMMANDGDGCKKRTFMLSNNVSARIQMTVLGNGANHHPSVLVTTDKVNHLFNCGEGTQRLLIEHNKHLRLNKIQNVLLTNSTYENWSGLFGLILTMAEVKKNLSVYGSSQFEKIVKMYKPFIYSAKDLQLNHVIVDDNDGFKNLIDDDDFVIRSMRLKDSIAYMFLVKDKVGRLQIEKCKEFNIQPGPKFAALKNGQQIEVDGRIINPEDVLGPPEPGSSFIILECSTQEDLDCLIKIGDFSQWTLGKPIQFLVHMTPNYLLENDYQEWLNSNFDSEKTTHIFLNDQNEHELSLISSSELQIKLNLIDSKIFPLLNEKQLTESWKSSSNHSNIIVSCPTLFTYRIRPTGSQSDHKPPFEVLDSNCCKLDSEKIQTEIIEQTDFQQSLRQYGAEIDKRINSNSDNKSQLYPNILFLGTASSQPGKQRNTSSILLALNPEKSIMFDCGESTVLQMNRFFGRTPETKSELNQIFRSIQAVFISHFHADHHFGLVKLIIERSKIESSNPVIVIAPYSILKFLTSFSKRMNDQNLAFSYEGIPCASFIYQKTQLNNKQELLNRLSLNDLTTVIVPHCHESYGIVVTDQKGRRIAYSGDSMFSNAFDQAGDRCHLLIHEATMNDDLAEEAKQKRHSTITEAVRVGQKIHAKYTLLTHFSQRYAKMAPINLIEDQSLVEYIDNRVGISFDFMHVPIHDMWKVVKLKGSLKMLFDEEIQKMQDVAWRRTAKRKLTSS